MNWEALVLKLKTKTKNKIETKYSAFYSNSKAETSIHDTDMNQSKVQLWQKFKISERRLGLDYWFNSKMKQFFKLQNSEW